jgi:hypothetical protein
VDPQDSIQFSKTGKLEGGNFISTESSRPSSEASTPFPSRPASSLPSHSYTLHQVSFNDSIATLFLNISIAMMVDFIQSKFLDLHQDGRLLPQRR